MQNKIILHNCHFLCNIGVGDEERKNKQEIFIDLELFCDIKKASESDDIKNTVNYSEVHRAIKNLVENKEYKLVETLAEDVASVVLGEFEVERVVVRLRKPEALQNRGVEWVGVEIDRV